MKSDHLPVVFQSMFCGILNGLFFAKIVVAGKWRLMQTFGNNLGSASTMTNKRMNQTGKTMRFYDYDVQA